jgi:Zn-finger nucleic acid-binding protein
MTCPRCLNQPLETRDGPKGIKTEECRSCGGVWLDKSEIYYYAADPQKLYAAIAEAYKTPTTSRFLCRRCDVQMFEVVFPKGPAVDVCRQCGGVWLDKGEIVGVLLSAGA